MQDTNNNLKPLFIFMGCFLACLATLILLMLFTDVFNPVFLAFKGFLGTDNPALAGFIFIIIMPLVLFIFLLAAYAIVNLIKDTLAAAKNKQ